MARRHVPFAIVPLAALLCLSACHKSESPIVTKESSAPFVTGAAPKKGEVESIWCRGGGKSSAATKATLSVSGANAKGAQVETDFEFDAADQPGGNDGHQLKPGTCGYEARPYGSGKIKLQYKGEERIEIHWNTTATGTTPPVMMVAADRVRSDNWLMKAQVKDGEIQSFKESTF